MQKGLAPILIVILIALVVGGYMFIQKQIKPTIVPQSITQPSPSATPTVSDETVCTEASRSANWKTCTSSIYSFKYPSNWQEIKKGKLSDNRVMEFRGEDSDFMVVARENPKNLSISDWIKNPDEYTKWNIDLTEITVDNLKGMQLSTEMIGIESGVKTYITEAYISKGGFIYRIQYSLPRPLEKTDLKTFNQILSTFKFTQ